MLKSLLLNNWRSHKSTKLSLANGSNIFLGPMGSGKSSVVDALCFALYGTYPKLARRDVKLDDVCNFRHPKDEVRVELTFKIGDIGYDVRRSVNSAQAWLYADKRLVLKGPKKVSEKIEEILQIPYELFTKAVYAEQNRLDYWLSLRAGQRKSELDSLLGLDRFESARKNANKDMNQIQQKAKDIESLCPKEKIDNLKGQLDEIEKRAKKNQVELDALQRQKSISKEKIILSKKQLDSLLKKRDDIQRLQKTRDELEGKKSAYSSQLQKKPDHKKDEINAEQKRLSESLVSNKREVQDIQKMILDDSDKIGKLRQRIDDLISTEKRQKELSQKLLDLMQKSTKEELEEKIKHKKRALEQIQESISSSQTNINDLNKILSALNTTDRDSSTCPLCDSTLGGSDCDKLKEKKYSELQAHNKNIDKKRADQKNLRKELEALEKKHSDYLGLRATLDALKTDADLPQLKKELSEAEARSKILQVKRKEIEQTIQEIEKEKNRSQKKLDEILQFEKTQEFLDKVQDEIKTTDSMLKSIDFSEQELEGSRKNHETNRLEDSRLDQNLLSIKRLIAVDKGHIDSIRPTYNDLVQKRQDAQRLRKKIDELQLFCSAVQTTQHQLRSRLIADLNSLLSKLWPLLYPYGDWSKVRIKADEKDYILQIYQNEWRGLEQYASGGERACLGLALRTALSVLLTPHLGWVILDEPTHNLDKDSVKILGLSLSEKLPQVIPQVIAITHDLELVESTPSKVFEFIRDKKKGEDTTIKED